MPTCDKCGIKISDESSEKFYGLCYVCYEKLMNGSNPLATSKQKRRPIRRNVKGKPPKELYCKKCKMNVVPVEESYSPKHTLGFLMDDSSMTRGVRCPSCNKKLNFWNLPR